VQYWTVRIGVSDSWVADGYGYGGVQATQERIRECLWSDLMFATPEEVTVEIIDCPEQSVIDGLQNGYEEIKD
jgi:hypothetical protein